MIPPDVEKFLVENQNVILTLFRTIEEQKSMLECTSAEATEVESAPETHTPPPTQQQQQKPNRSSRHRHTSAIQCATSTSRPSRPPRRHYHLPRSINSAPYRCAKVEKISKRRCSPERVLPSRCAGVFGMSQYTDERDLHSIFREFGRIEKIHVIRDHHNQRSRGFGFVYFRTISEAERAIEALSDATIDGHRVRVDFSTTYFSSR